jgi:hypothetical protein
MRPGWHPARQGAIAKPRSAAIIHISSLRLPAAQVAANPHTIAVLTTEGGHVAWPTGWWPTAKSWDNALLVQYIRAVLNLPQTSRAWAAGAAALTGNGTEAGPAIDVTRGTLPTKVLPNGRKVVDVELIRAESERSESPHALEA